MRFKTFFLPLFFASLSSAPIQSSSLGFLGRAASFTALALSSRWSPADGQNSFLHTVGTVKDDVLVSLAAIPGGDGFQTIGYSDFNTIICADHFDNGTLRSFNGFDAGSAVQIYDSLMTPYGTYIAGWKPPAAYGAFITRKCDAIFWGGEFLTDGDSRSFSAVAATSYGSTIFAGFSHKKTKSSVILVNMMVPIGTKIWERKIDLIDSVNGLVAMDIDKEDALYIAGSVSGPPLFTYDIFLMKVSASGDVQYVKGYAFQAFNKIDDLKVVDRHVMITGHTRKNPGKNILFYAKLDSARGDRVYFHTISLTSSMGRRLAVGQKGGVLITGFYTDPVNGDYPIALEARADGIIESAYSLRSTNNRSRSQALGGVQDLEGAITIAGYSDGFRNGLGTDFFIAKIGSSDRLGCSAELAVDTLDLTDLVKEYRLNIMVDPLFTTSFSPIAHTATPLNFSTAEVCALTPSPTADPTHPIQDPIAQPSNALTLPILSFAQGATSHSSRIIPASISTLEKQTAVVGELYSFSFLLSRYVAYEGDFSTLTLDVSNISLQNKSTDWLYFNNTLSLFKGRAQQEDRIRVFLKVTDEQGANAISSFLISVEPPSPNEEDTVASFLKNNLIVPVSLGATLLLVFGSIFCDRSFFECLAATAKVCYCLYKAKKIRRRVEQTKLQLAKMSYTKQNGERQKEGEQPTEPIEGEHTLLEEASTR